MDGPDPDILPAVRARIAEAEAQLRDACSLLADNGWPENSSELRRSLDHVGVWTMKNGWLDCIEKD